jgi:hypothetical protein
MSRGLGAQMRVFISHGFRSRIVQTALRRDPHDVVISAAHPN